MSKPKQAAVVKYTPQQFDEKVRAYLAGKLNDGRALGDVLDRGLGFYADPTLPKLQGMVYTHTRIGKSFHVFLAPVSVSWGVERTNIYPADLPLDEIPNVKPFSSAASLNLEVGTRMDYPHDILSSADFSTVDDHRIERIRNTFVAGDLTGRPIFDALDTLVDRYITEWRNPGRGVAK